MKVAVILLTWKRVQNLKLTLHALNIQTRKDFDVYVSNGSLHHRDVQIVEKYVNAFPNLNIFLSHDGNDEFTFRRFTKGRELAKLGYDVIMYIDDDITISQKYIEKCLSQYEPKTYKSGYAWRLLENGQNYYKKRTKIFDPNERVDYCGTGISMIDSSIFLNDKLFKKPEGAEKIEDLWLSYFVDNLEGWRLSYMDVGDVVIRGSDNVALFREVGASSMNKAVFLRMLVNKYKWKL